MPEVRNNGVTSKPNTPTDTGDAGDRVVTDLHRHPVRGTSQEVDA